MGKVPAGTTFSVPVCVSNDLRHYWLVLGETDKELSDENNLDDRRGEQRRGNEVQNWCCKPAMRLLKCHGKQTRGRCVSCCAVNPRFLSPVEKSCNIRCEY